MHKTYWRMLCLGWMVGLLSWKVAKRIAMPIMFPISVSMVTRGHRILPCFDHGACCILLWIWPHNGNQYYIDNYIQPETMFQNSFQVDFITSTLGWLKSPSANIVLGSLWNSSFLTTPEIIVKSEEQQHSWSGTPSFYCFNQYKIGRASCRERV